MLAASKSGALSLQKVVEANVPLASPCMLLLQAAFLTMKALLYHPKLPSLRQTDQTSGTPCLLCGKSKARRPLTEALVTLQPSPTLPSTKDPNTATGGQKR
jgi:hypothetical protein